MSYIVSRWDDYLIKIEVSNLPNPVTDIRLIILNRGYYFYNLNMLL